MTNVINEHFLRVSRSRRGPTVPSSSPPPGSLETFGQLTFVYITRTKSSVVHGDQRLRKEIIHSLSHLRVNGIAMNARKLIKVPIVIFIFH